MFRSPRHPTILLVVLGSFLALRSVPCATAPEPGDLRGVGKVTFPITCTSDVQSDFARGVALLHSFFYEEARRVFTSVAERDPNCAMGNRHDLVASDLDPADFRRNARRQNIHQKAMAMNVGTDRERGLITAL